MSFRMGNFALWVSYLEFEIDPEILHLIVSIISKKYQLSDGVCCYFYYLYYPSHLTLFWSFYLILVAVFKVLNLRN